MVMCEGADGYVGGADGYVGMGLMVMWEWG